MVYVFLAEGFEECEAFAPVDLLRRAQVKVNTVAVGGNKTVTSAHGVPVVCDIAESEAVTENLSMIVLPGGLPGTLNLEKSAFVQRYIDYAADRKLWIAAICAAPSILGHKGMLKGRAVTCFPSFEKDCEGAKLQSEFVVVDGKIITGKGMGVAHEFGLKLVEVLEGAEKAAQIRQAVQCR